MLSASGCDLLQIVNYEMDVIWAEVDGQKLKLDVCWPDSDEQLPMIVNFHSGGWSKYSKELDIPLCIYLANQGFTVFNVNYRLAPGDKFPAQVNDALGAVIWAKDHAHDYNGDPAKVAVMGSSSGGNLAVMVGMAGFDPFFEPTAAEQSKHNSQVDAVISLYGVYDMYETYAMHGWFEQFSDPRKILEDYLGGSPDEVPEFYDRASPTWYLYQTPVIPRTLIICGDQDPLFSQSEMWAKAMHTKRMPYTFFISDNMTHGYTSFPLTGSAYNAYDKIADFLDEHL